MARNADTCDLLCLDLPKAERVREQLPGVGALERWATAAKALGDPTRLAVADVLEAALDVHLLAVGARKGVGGK